MLFVNNHPTADKKLIAKMHLIAVYEQGSMSPMATLRGKVFQIKVNFYLTRINGPSPHARVRS